MASAGHNSRFRGPVRVGAVGLLVAVAGFTGPVSPAAADVVPIQLLSVNDFHGRIDENALRFAGTIETERAEVGAANTLLLGAGDLIGASGFASAVQQDVPTLDFFNLLGMATSAVGNHEFDQGLADLTDRVEPAADFSYLGANVYAKGTQDPVLQEFDTFDVAGVTVAVVGVVTQETPSLVSPAGVSTVDFGDPVAAVNRVAAQLTDGDAANGEADIIVASVHEGAPVSESDEVTLADAEADSAVFASIVNDISPDVDVILNGHTHQVYSFDAPVPGDPQRTRPVLQTGNYAQNVGEVRLSYDTETDTVTSYTVENIPTLASSSDDDDVVEEENAAIEAALLLAFPDPLEAVKASIDDALAVAAEIGNQPKGSVTADITTAFSGGAYVNGVYTGGKRDDRGAESALGNLVADSMVEVLSDPQLGGAEIGVVNPGGLRNELLYAPDGVITYAEANGVLPFVNNLWTVTLTGAQFKAVLEQQWQTNADGTVPSRAYLQLGLSDNVSYTFDPAAPQGEHITSVVVDGEPLLADETYRVGTFNFLAQGGDNFRAFAEGTDITDSGLVDRDAWIAYLVAHPGLTPEFDKHAVAVTGLADLSGPGATTTLNVSSLNMTSLGAPENTTLTTRLLAVSADGGEPVVTELGSVAVLNGAATVPFTVPAAGAYFLEMAAAPSGTLIAVPLLVVGGPTTTPTTTPPPTTSAAPVAPTTTKATSTPTTKPTKGQLASTGISDEDSIATTLVATALIGLGGLLVVVGRRRQVVGRHQG